MTTFLLLPVHILPSNCCYYLSPKMDLTAHLKLWREGWFSVSDYVGGKSTFFFLNIGLLFSNLILEIKDV